MFVHQLPPLPYARNALEPHLSEETLTCHYDKHHHAYVEKLNDLVAGTKYENQSLDLILTNANGAIFNNAAQVWNHTFYWNSLAPDGGGEPTGDLELAIRETFGSYADFMKKFSTVAAGIFGSGWAWLVRDANGSVAIQTTPNARRPPTMGFKPLLVCDIWEHAYYIDYRNSRPDYLKAYWSLVNWKFAQRNFES